MLIVLANIIKMKAYNPLQFLVDFKESVSQGTQDILNIIKVGEFSVLSQLRAYDLLEQTSDTVSFKAKIEMLKVQLGVEVVNKALLDLSLQIKSYNMAYQKYSEELDKVFDAEKMSKLAKNYAKPWEKKYLKAKKEYQDAVELWELAKKTQSIFENGNFIKRYFALRKLRNKAGFKLERGKVGNYVTRTFDLMQEAFGQMRKAELDKFSHNVEYKCTSQMYGKIYNGLKELMD